LFCALGFGVSAAVGPFGVVQLGSNPWVNGFIALIFGAFALSLLGAFEITLPSSLLTRLDQASRRGGYLGTLLMGLTFSLTSFACVGPFLGTILAASVQDKGAAPVLGMASFATGLASPFFFLAAFPSYLKKLPRSGGWLARVKVVMGFAVLAFMLKYLSNVDQVLQLNWITRDRFLAAWFVLFTMAGLYLLGLLRLEGIEAGESLGIGRLLTASVILIFAFSLLPGMFGAPLGELDAFVPVAAEGGPRGSAEAGQPWLKNQYREALDKARQEKKLVLVSFTGYACTNCHWMKANMWPRPEIADAMKDLVLVELYTDGTDKASEENQKLEDDTFKTVAIPYYAILDPDGKVLATLPGRSTNPAEVLAFVKAKSAS
jgi:thiol:disulfide interchange protein